MSQGGYGSVKQYIGCDSHARYSVFVSVDEKAGKAIVKLKRDGKEKLLGLGDVKKP